MEAAYFLLVNPRCPWAGARAVRLVVRVVELDRDGLEHAPELVGAICVRVGNNHPARLAVRRVDELEKLSSHPTQSLTSGEGIQYGGGAEARRM